MSALTSIQSNLDSTTLALAQESAARQASSQNADGSGGELSGDVVSIDDGAYQRRAIDLNLNAKTISYDEAMSALDYVRNQSVEDLSDAHYALDAGRVYQLLGLSE
jgi:hypothetical protein